MSRRLTLASSAAAAGRQAISTSFLPAAVPAPPSLRVLQIHPDVTSVRGNMFHPPTSHDCCMPTLWPPTVQGAEGKAGARRWKNLAGVHSGHRRPELGPSGAASCHLPSCNSTSTRAPAPTPRGNKHGHCAVVTPSPSSHLRYQRAMVQHPPLS